MDMIIQVSSGHDVRAVADRLREAGVQVERELVRTRVVGGKVPRSLLGQLEKIPGVKMVRKPEPFGLPPFEENIPQ